MKSFAWYTLGPKLKEDSVPSVAEPSLTNLQELVNVEHEHTVIANMEKVILDTLTIIKLKNESLNENEQ